MIVVSTNGLVEASLCTRSTSKAIAVFTGATNPSLTSADPDEVTCYFCRKRVEWKADPENQRRVAEANARLET
jgi:hypothetical protein